MQRAQYSLQFQEDLDRQNVGKIFWIHSLQQQLEAHANGSWMHADDVVHNQKMVEALAFVIKDFDHGL